MGGRVGKGGRVGEGGGCSVVLGGSRGGRGGLGKGRRSPGPVPQDLAGGGGDFPEFLGGFRTLLGAPTIRAGPPGGRAGLPATAGSSSRSVRGARPAFGAFQSTSFRGVPARFPEPPRTRRGLRRRPAGPPVLPLGRPAPWAEPPGDLSGAPSSPPRGLPKPFWDPSLQRSPSRTGAAPQPKGAGWQTGRRVGESGGMGKSLPCAPAGNKGPTPPQDWGDKRGLRPPPPGPAPASAPRSPPPPGP